MNEVNHAEEGNEGEQQSEKSENETKEHKKEGKYVFQCQRCGQCCEKKESVVVSMADLERWSKDVTLPSLYPFLTIEVINDDYTQISLKKPESDEGKTHCGCPLFDAENKLCNIYYSMPLYCRSFPLGYDGNRHFLKDSKCLGIGKGTMDEEALKDARNTAKDDFEARVATTLLLPVIHTLALRFILEQSKKQMDRLTDEQKEQLKGIFGKEIKESTGAGEVSNDIKKDGKAEK